MKLSETPSKIPNPGDKQVWRIYDLRWKATADLITLEDENPAKWPELFLHHPDHRSIYRTLAREKVVKIEPMLKEVVREGRRTADMPTIDAMRAVKQADLDCLDSGVKRLMNPHIYHVSLSERLWELKRHLIESIRNQK
jgi:nicotinate phosphoribosyltransferase